MALSFSENDPSHIRDKIFSELRIEDLKKETGMAILVEFMDKLFKKDELTEVYEYYVSFERYKHSQGENVESLERDTTKQRIMEWNFLRMLQHLIAFRWNDAGPQR